MGRSAPIGKFGERHRFYSEPRPHAHKESNLSRIAPILAYQGRGLTKAPVEGDADIGGKFSPDLVPQPSPEFKIIEARSGRKFLDSLDSGVSLEASLEDQPLRQQQVFRERQPGGHLAVLIDEQRGLELVVVRDKPFDSDYPKTSRHIAPLEGLCFDTAAHLQIVMLPDKPAIQQLKVHVVVCLEGRVALPFAFEPKSVVVPAIPPLDVPPVVVMSLPSAYFRTVVEDVDEREETVLLIVDGRRPMLLWRDGRSCAYLPNG